MEDFQVLSNRRGYEIMADKGQFIPSYKGYKFISDDRLNGEKFAYKLNSGTKNLYVSPGIYEGLYNDFDEIIQTIKIKDLSKVSLKDIQNPVLQDLKQFDKKQRGKNVNSLSQQDTAQVNEDEQPGKLVRLLITIPRMYCDVDNKAPDFVDPELDELRVSVVLYNSEGDLITASGKEHTLSYNGYDIEKTLREYSLEGVQIWFDLNMDKAKEAWLGSVDFVLKSDYERYLNYKVTEADYHLQWLEKDEDRNNYRSLSMTKKVYKSHLHKPQTEEHSYMHSEILEVVKRLNRAIKKVDWRTGGAYVNLKKVPEDHEALIEDIADELGFVIDRLDDELIEELSKKNKKATHMIALKR